MVLLRQALVLSLGSHLYEIEREGHTGPCRRASSKPFSRLQLGAVGEKTVPPGLLCLPECAPVLKQGAQSVPLLQRTRRPWPSRRKAFFTVCVLGSWSVGALVPSCPTEPKVAKTQCWSWEAASYQKPISFPRACRLRTLAQRHAPAGVCRTKRIV